MSDMAAQIKASVVAYSVSGPPMGGQTASHERSVYNIVHRAAVYQSKR